MMPHQPEDNELLDYQTEQGDEPQHVQPIEPVPVHVCEPVVTIETVPQHVSCYTITLTQDMPYAQVLPLDVLRVRASLLRCDNHFVLCHSLGQAQDANNSTTGSTVTNGALITATFNAPVPVSGVQEMWVATNVFPTNIGVIVERRDA